MSRIFYTYKDIITVVIEYILGYLHLDSLIHHICKRLKEKNCLNDIVIFYVSLNVAI